MKFFRLFLITGIFFVIPLMAFATSAYPPPPNIRITTIPQLNNEEQVWICPTDSNIIIADWRDFRLGYRQVGIGRSTDGGLTWIDSLIPPSMQHSTTLSWQSDPTMTVDRLGNFYISVLDFDDFGSFSFISFYKSTDKGVSWTGPVNHLPVTDPSVWIEDKQFITTDRTGGLYDGNLYCAWARFPFSDGNRMAFIRSINGGASFQPPIIIGPTQSSSGCGPGISSGQFPIPVVSSNGNVHCFWLAVVLDSGLECSGYDGFKHVVSTDGGQSFNGGDVIMPVFGWWGAENGTNIYSNPAADADISAGPFDGNIYIAFSNHGPEDAAHPYRADVDFIRSTDNAVSWSSRLQINDDATASASDSYHPWLIVNEDGVVIVIFYDTRFDAPSHLLFDLMAAYSFDGGETFTSNHRISTVSSDAGDLKRAEQSGYQMQYDKEGNSTVAVLSPMAGLIGEYIGVTAFHDKINAVWTDSRDGNSEVYTANWYLPLLEPRLFAPADSGFGSANPAFSWATAWKHNEDRYRLEVSDNPGFASGVQSFVTDTTFQLMSPDLPEGTYYWRVKSLKTNGPDSSAYSETRVYYVDNTPPEPTQLLSPAEGLITFDPTPTFDWSDVTKSGSPVNYDLWLSIFPSFPTLPPFDTGTVIYYDIPVSEFTPPVSLAANVFTYWKVRARDLAGNASGSLVGTVKYIPFICGDIDNNGTASTILDLNFLVNRIFRNGPLPTILQAADLDGSGGLPGILDLNFLVNKIFRNGPLPTCGL